MTTTVKMVDPNTPKRKRIVIKKNPDKMEPKNYFVGVQGSHVKWLADRLVAHGFGKVYANGTDTHFTEAEDKAAVTAFQKKQGWSGAHADGLPGVETLNLLAAEPKPVATKPYTLTIVTANIAKELTEEKFTEDFKYICDFMKPDLFGINEATGRSKIFRALAKAYGYGVALPPGAQGAATSNALFYRLDKFDLVEATAVKMQDGVISIPIDS